MTNIENFDPKELPAHIETASDAIVFFHKVLCPHCKNMEKVLAKFTKKVGGVEICGVDSKDASELMEEYGVERVPSLVFVKAGKMVHVKTGLLNPKELIALYNTL